jgi:hypothetical protein
MNRELNAEAIGEQLGTEGVGSLVSKVEAYCAYEEQRITLTNKPRIVELQAEGSFLLEEQRDLTERLRLAPPPGDVRSRRRKAFYYGCVAAFLTVAGFAFTLYSLEPFRLGLIAYLYCLGVSIIMPFTVDYAIEQMNAKLLTKTVAVIAAGAGLMALMFLAIIRGNLLAESTKDTNPVILFDDAQPQASSTENHFYEKTTPELQLVMILLALAMELGAGIALHEVWRFSSQSTEDWDKLRRREQEMQARLSAIAAELTSLQNQPREYVSRFWANFYRAMLRHTIRSAVTKLFLALLIILGVSHQNALAQSHTTLVIAVDLSRSVAVRGPDGKSEFQKNIDAVTKLLTQVSTDSHVSVIGITDHSFTQPNILLSAKIPADPGYFGERLNAARRELARTWKLRSSTLQPRYRHTDILGALLLASEIYSNHSPVSHKMLIVYSDMRQSTPDLDLESTSVIDTSSVFRDAPMTSGSLQGVQVLIRGVDGSGKSSMYWQSLQEFWRQYLRSTGGSLVQYSVLR